MYRILHIETGEYVYKDGGGGLYVKDPDDIKRLGLKVAEYKTLDKAHTIFNKDRHINLYDTYTRLNKKTKILFLVFEVKNV